MSIELPYMNSTGLIKTILDKIIEAQTPPRYNHDFQSTKLGNGSGSARPFVSLLKKIGFIGEDGVPSGLYKEFRNSSHRGQAMAKAIKKGYAPLYAINEYAHALEGKKLKDAIIQVTGHEQDSSTVKGIVGTFNALKSFADFEYKDIEELNTGSKDNYVPQIKIVKEEIPASHTAAIHNRGMNLSYTINLNLPETKDTEVFDAIFTSLKEKLLS